MTVSQVGGRGTAWTSTDGGSLTVPYAQAPTAGDLLVLTISATAFNAAPTCSTPSGWTSATGFDAHNTIHTDVFIFYKIAAGGDAAPVTTIALTGGGSAYAVVEEWAGIDPAAPLRSVSNGAGGGQVSGTTSDSMTPTAGDLMRSVFALSDPSSPSVSWDGAWTVDQHGVAANYTGYASAYRVETTTGSRTAAMSFSGAWSAYPVWATRAAVFAAAAAPPSAAVPSFPASSVPILRAATR